MITTHQQLLEAYFKAELRDIAEYSSSIEAGTKDLIEEVKLYGESHSLDTSFLQEYDYD